MTRVKLYYEGWLALPAALRDALGLRTDSMLEAELVEGTIVLRPAGTAKNVAVPEPEQVTPELPAAAAAPVLPVLAKRKPGRPRKAEAVEPVLDLMPDLPEAPFPARRKPGRPRKVLPVQQLELEPVPAPAPLTVLRRQVMPPATAQAQLAVPGQGHAWAEPVTKGELEERRPFRHVEIRKLAPRPRAGGRRRVAVAAE